MSANTASPAKNAPGSHGGQQDAEDEGTVGGDGGGPSDHATGLSRLEDHRHLLEGRGVSDPGEEEDGDHAPEERAGTRRRTWGTAGTTCKRCGRGDAQRGHEGHPRAADAVGDRAGDDPGCRADERAPEGVLDGVDSGVPNASAPYRLLDQQAELGGEAGERAEGDDVEDGHQPRVLVAEDVHLLASRRAPGPERCAAANHARITRDDDEGHPDVCRRSGTRPPCRRPSLTSMNR